MEIITIVIISISTISNSNINDIVIFYKSSIKKINNTSNILITTVITIKTKTTILIIILKITILILTATKNFVEFKDTFPTNPKDMA